MASPRNLAVVYWTLDRLRVEPGNPRTHPAAQVERIAASVTEFGWTNPVLAAPDGGVIAGEARLAAARKLGLGQVPVIVLGGLTPAQRQAYRVADNRLPLDAVWDEALLAEVFNEIVDAGLDLAITGFTDAEIGELLSGDGLADEGPDEPAAPPLEEKTVTRLGDLWVLGKHRLICGDSTDERVIRRLVDVPPAAAVVDMAFADPPYGMAYDGGRANKEVGVVMADPPYGMSFGKGKERGSTVKGALVKAHGQILGDDAKGEGLIDLVSGALIAARAVCRDGAAFYVCLTWRTYKEFLAAIARAGLRVAACIVWDKGSIGLGHQHYRPRHEFVFYCAGARWFGDRSEGDVWTFTRGDTGSYIHPTQKPVALIERALENSSVRGDGVLDPFGGSGSTLIACERLSRRAFLSELDPRYCDAIIRRWQVMTGRAARHLSESSTFSQLAAARAGAAS